MRGRLSTPTPIKTLLLHGLPNRWDVYLLHNDSMFLNFSHFNQQIYIKAKNSRQETGLSGQIAEKSDLIYSLKPQVLLFLILLPDDLIKLRNLFERIKTFQ